MDEPFFIVDLRPEWNRNGYVTFWRANNAGYCYGLVFAGRYTREEVDAGGSYYTAKAWTSPKGPGRLFTRFAVRCSDIEALATPSDKAGRWRLDESHGLTVRNSGVMRHRLRRLRYLPRPASIPTP